ncbi:hypothetical protein EYC59_04640 [Candidatus Saccharibacteria bacterium]|nr:MAG: hypothetical protein EYC59_04640 [Candidatus Saccharibacteria bacterium]
MGATWTIFLGAILAFLATGTVEWLKNNTKKLDRIRQYKLYARLQLASILKVLDKLKHSYENGGTYAQLIRDIKLLEKASEPLNGVRSNTTILPEQDTQEKLIDLIADLNLYVSDISSLVSAHGTPEDSTEGDQKLLSKNIELVELRRRIEELIKALS